MTKEWVLSTFPVDYDETVIVFEGKVDGFYTTNELDAGALVSICSPTSDPPTYVELSALPIAKSGWQKFFDQWKEKGIIN